MFNPDSQTTHYMKAVISDDGRNFCFEKSNQIGTNHLGFQTPDWGANLALWEILSGP